MAARSFCNVLLLLVPRLALAQPETAGARAEPEKVEADQQRFQVGLRAFLAPHVGIVGYGLGIDGAYSLLPYFAVGAQHLEFRADQGADPYYCSRCIRSGHSTFAFAEGRYWPNGFITPYARAGLGLTHLHGQRIPYDSHYSEDDLTLLAELGLDFHYRFASLRTFAFRSLMLDTSLGRDPFTAFGAELGGRF